MRIAQVAPLEESVPPKRYGGTERVVHYLTEELVARGHDVVLFASGDSQTSANLVPCVGHALRASKQQAINTISRQHRPAPELVQLEQVLGRIEDFDLLHFHTGLNHLATTARLPLPQIHTIHGPLAEQENKALIANHRNLPLVAISRAQAQAFPLLNWRAIVHHGLPLDLYGPGWNPEEYLVFLGRISPEKRLDRAIQIAQAVGLPLKVAAKVDLADKQYFETTIEPLLRSNSSVEFVGEVDEVEKQVLLANALALLFPIDWPEPFGLVMIEANACGTPVVAWRNGSTPEVVREGVNGVLVDSIGAAADAVRGIGGLDRRLIRADFEQRFSVKRQAEDYEKLYLNTILDRDSSRLIDSGLCHAS